MPEPALLAERMVPGTRSTAGRGPAYPGRPPGGTVIFPNGRSSSGKSSIAAEPLRIPDDRYFHLPADALHAMRSKREILPHQFQDVIDSTCRGFHRAAAGMAARGGNIGVDHVFSQSRLTPPDAPHTWRRRPSVPDPSCHCAPQEACSAPAAPAADRGAASSASITPSTGVRSGER
ncbi:phosphotransferase-like protein [Streptomyces sp. NBC_00388]|uniref:phosphotransferase-like protein n=1 Tax=Streptomyces sp. NBC_00388 TaxID=2975735 RepID=UPI002E1FCB84